MNTASLELCKKLYQLSEWQDEFDYAYGRWHGSKSIELQYMNVPRSQGFSMVAPAYSLDFLLRKLPRLWSLYQREKGGYHIQIELIEAGHMIGRGADSPEDAACKLTIELFKQGILTK